MFGKRQDLTPYLQSTTLFDCPKFGVHYTDRLEVWESFLNPRFRNFLVFFLEHWIIAREISRLYFEFFQTQADQ